MEEDDEEEPEIVEIIQDEPVAPAAALEAVRTLRTWLDETSELTSALVFEARHALRRIERAFAARVNAQKQKSIIDFFKCAPGPTASSSASRQA
ncbi:hypothetical protein V8E36_003753 [Tilletia maclaganii]